VKLYLFITIFCCLLAVGLNFFMKCGADITTDIRMITNGETDVKTIMELKKTYEEKTGKKVQGANDIDAAELEKQDLEKLKKEMKDKLDPSQIEEYKDIYKKYKGSDKQ